MAAGFKPSTFQLQDNNANTCTTTTTRHSRHFMWLRELELVDRTFFDVHWVLLLLFLFLIFVFGRAANEVVFRRRRRRVDDGHRFVRLVRAVVDRREAGARLETRALVAERDFPGPAFPRVVVVFVVVGFAFWLLVAVEVSGETGEPGIREDKGVEKQLVVAFLTSYSWKFKTTLAQ